MVQDVAPASLCRGLRGLGLVLVLASRPLFADPPPTAPSPPAPLPATGQTEPYPAYRAGGRAGAATVPDDGEVRAGAPLRFRDNGDGTITDLNTRLMWEKKCTGCEGPHNVHTVYRWSANGQVDTIWDWLRQINAEGGRGLAGHSDWRIPNVTELISIIDYGRADPAVTEDFRSDACEDGCPDPKRLDCSCTEVEEYWSSTTFADFPAHAITVSFGSGLADDSVKSDLHYVRAVRGGE